MRFILFMILAIICAVVLQLGILPCFLPHWLHPDVGIVLAMAVLAYAPREEGLIGVFALGVAADLFGSARFGLLTLSYLLAAGVILWLAWRELTRGDLIAAWFGGVAGTMLAHLLYLIFARLSGMSVLWGTALSMIAAWTFAALVWGLFIAWACGKCLYRFGLLAPAVRDRWAMSERNAAARRSKGMR